jgi:HK97 family phage major capsid protein
MRIQQLEIDLAAKQDAFRALHRDLTALFDAENRESTAEERARLQALLDEAKAIKVKVDRAKSDAAMAAEIDALYQRAATPTGQSNSILRSSTGAVVRPTERQIQTLGTQWTNSEAMDFFKKGMHRTGGARWASPTVELEMHATTLSEAAGSGGPLVIPQYLPGILPLLFKRLMVADLLASGTTNSNAIVYMKETTFTNAATPVAEGAAKPESALIFAQVTELVSKIAHWLPVTEEMLEDVAAIASYIDARLRLGVALAEEDQLLNGNGTPPNLLGLLNRAGLATPIAQGVAPDTAADAIFRQVAAIATTSFVYPDGIVINPTNWANIILMKTSQGAYIAGGPFAPSMPTTLWGLSVAPTPSIVAGTALVGAFGTMAQFFRRGGLRVEASNSHQDFFIKNLVAIRAEERGALAVYRPGAFGKVTSLT